MQELGPLLTPPDNMPPEHAGLQRFKHYFNAIAHALPACQANEPASAPADPERPVTDGLHWTCLTVPAVNILALFAKFTQQLPATACCEVTAFSVYTLAHMQRVVSLGSCLSWRAILNKSVMLLNISNCAFSHFWVHIWLPTPDGSRYYVSQQWLSSNPVFCFGTCCKRERNQ